MTEQERYQQWKEQFHIQLNAQQEAAVQAVQGPVLLLAVPGSGKTTVLINRLGYMIFCKGILPESILTVTYTVAATNDMRRRFEQTFGEEMSRRLEFRTINGISQKILHYYGKLTGKTPFPLAEKETGAIIKQVFFQVTKQFPTENDVKTVQTAITYVKNMGLTEEEIEKLDVEVSSFPDIYHGYQQALRQKCLIDYDDQMVYALQLLKQFPVVLEHFQNLYPYICVDEAQDTSKIQHEMLALLAGKTRNLFMVGDEDQSIYGFRAAYPQALLSFDQTYPGAKVLLMESNYRSREEIVTSANRLIQHNEKRHAKQLCATREAGGQMRQIPVKSRKAQFTYLLNVANQCTTQTAVLYRNNESALPLIDLLERNGIPYTMKNKDMTFFSHPVVSDLRDFLILAIHPCDEEAFLRIYYKMGAGISKAAATTAVRQNNGITPLLTSVGEMEGVSPYCRKQCIRLLSNFERMQTEHTGAAIRRVIQWMGYGMYMEEHGMDSKKADILQILGEQEQDCADFLEHLLELQELVATKPATADCPFILSTIHSSKGLEYDRVFLLDMMEGILPSGCDTAKKSALATEKKSEDYEEERRLYYVAMTRAKESLSVFSFSPGETSAFSKEVFGTPKSKKQAGVTVSKKIQQTPAYAISNQAAVQDCTELQKEMEAYQIGVMVEHKKYGTGAIVSRKEDVAEIQFQQDRKKLKLAFAISKQMIRVL